MISWSREFQDISVRTEKAFSHVSSSDASNPVLLGRIRGTNTLEHLLVAGGGHHHDPLPCHPFFFLLPFTESPEASRRPKKSFDSSKKLKLIAAAPVGF